MPFMLPAAASAIAAAAPAAAAASATASVTATLTSIATNIAMNMAMSAVMSALQPQVGAAGRTTEWTLSPDGPIPFAAGRIGVPGAAVHKATFGPDLMYYGIPSVLSGAGPIDGYESFKADDETVTFDANGKAISSQYAGELWFKTTMGNQPDVALVSPSGLKNGATLPGWSAAHKLSGLASYMVVMGENSKGTAFKTGEIKPTIVFRGLKGWDPRQDSTYPGGVGPCRLNDPSTWVYLRRPGLWGLKWALGLWAGPTLKGAPAHNSTTDYQVGGIGAKVSGIDVPAFVNLENICDANDWTVCAYPTTDDDKFAVLESFLQAAGATFAMRAGKISCIQRATPRTSVVTITAADTAGPLEIDTAANRIDRINTIRPRIVSENHRWQLTAITEVTGPAYRAEDGGTRPRGIDYTYVDKATQGAQLAALQIANTREGIAGMIPLRPHLQKIKPGDAFTITEPGFVLNGLKCLCLTSDFDPKTKIVAVSFVSETDAKYPYAYGQSQTAPVAPTLTVPDYTVTPPQGGEWTLSSVLFSEGASSVPALVFEGDVDNAMAQSVIFEFRPVGATDWSGAGTEEPTVTRKEAGGGLLTSGTQYEGAVSYRIGANFSARLILGPVTAGTVTIPPAPTPANVAGTPALDIFTAIQPDGTEVSSLTATWAAVTAATTYDIDIDDGTAVWTESRPVAAIKNLRVAAGRTYRFRVKGSNRDGVRSAAWSAWSNSVSAGGDTTAPAVVNSPLVTPLARRLILSWQNPADADFSHIRLYRNVSGAAHVEGDLYAVRVEGTTYTDTNVQAGVSYGYASKSVDRSGNPSGFRYMGAGTPAYISTGGGDVMPTDPDLVTGYGTSALVFGQTAWATSSLATSRLNYLDDSGNLDSLSRVTSRGLGLLTGRTADFIDYTAGGTVNSLRPGEAGANVTESRTAALVAGQGGLATRNSVTAAMMPLLNAENDFIDEDFDSTLVTPGVGSSFDTSAETTATMGIKRSIKSPIGNGTTSQPQALLNSTSTPNLIPVTPGQFVRFNVRSLVKAGFTGLLRSFRYFVGPTGTVIGSATIDTIVDRRSVAQAATTVYETEAAPLLVPAGASHSYFVVFLDWSGSQANAGYALFGKPRQRRIMDFGGLAVDAVRFGWNVRRADGLTPVTDATAITSLGTAALVQNQGPWTIYTGLIPANVAGQVQYLSTGGRVIDYRGLPLNVASGRGISFSPAFVFAIPGSNRDTTLSILASTVTLIGGATLALPSGTVTGLTAATGYSVFRDLQASTYVAIAGAAPTYKTSPDRYLYMGLQYTMQAGGGGYGPLPPPPPGSGDMPTVE